MENAKKQIRLDTFTQVIKKYLLSRGIKYVEGKDIYYFQVGKQNCCLSILKSKIKIENFSTKKVEIFDFKPTNDSIFTHGRFRANNLESVTITQSEAYFCDEKVCITSYGAKIAAPLNDNKCANLLLLFSDNLMGNTIYDTLDNLENFNGSQAVAISHDVPRVTGSKWTTNAMLRSEQVIHNEMSSIKTRKL